TGGHGKTACRAHQEGGGAGTADGWRLLHRQCERLARRDAVVLVGSGDGEGVKAACPCRGCAAECGGPITLVHKGHIGRQRAAHTLPYTTLFRSTGGHGKTACRAHQEGGGAGTADGWRLLHRQCERLARRDAVVL